MMALDPGPASTVNASDRARREQEHFDQLAGQQGEAWWGHLAAAGRARSARRARLVIENARLQSGDRALEVGCGGGFFTSNYIGLVPADVHVTAIDISPGLVAAAAAKPELAGRQNLSLEVQNVESLPYEAGCFNAIIGSSILHHLDLPRALPELNRVLASGGRFVFAEPNALNPLIFFEKHFKIGHKADQASPDEESINRFKAAPLLREYGFIVETIRPYDFLHPLTPRLLQPLVGLMGSIMEHVPVAREVAGSVLVVARRA